MTQRYDPKLRQAMGEIENILKKYDCAAMIGLFSKKFVEFKFEPHASWSLVEFKMSPDHTAKVKIKLRPKMQDEMDATAGFLFNARDLAQMLFTQINVLCEGLQKHAEITHTAFKDLNNDGRDIN